MLLRIVGALLVIWLAFVVIGFVVKSLFAIAIVGLVLFVGTAAYGAIRNNKRKQLP